VLVSLHQADFARRYCPRVLVLAQGGLVYDGPPDDLTPPAPLPSQGRGEPAEPGWAEPESPPSPMEGNEEDSGYTSAGSAGSPPSPYGGRGVGEKGSVAPLGGPR
jgi:hypothetical protein